MAVAVMTAKLGTDAFAAHQVGMNVMSLSFSFGDGMQVAAVALIGRSLGEEKPELAKIYGATCQKMGQPSLWFLPYFICWEADCCTVCISKRPISSPWALRL